ncbi:MAG: hypothetical protein V1810_00625 [Candidatus Beckwithbacteria bacterium]
MSLTDDLRSAIKSASKDWKQAKEKIRRQESINSWGLSRLRSYRPPRQTVKDAAFKVMKEAINKASGNGRYYANARQIMYAARPMILEITGGETWKDSAYFTQTLLKDYIEQYGGGEKIVWDARGHLVEPHTRKIVPLGGIDVLEYANGWRSDFDVFEDNIFSVGIKTFGPKLRYGSVLFIEKEGFSEILDDIGIAEKFDIAIMSTKGLPVGAACKLASKLAVESKILVLHDFDLAGFKILQTLRHGTRLAPGTEVTDIGFRLSDVSGLQSEVVEYKQSIDPRIYLQGCGATKEECDFLVRRQQGMKAWIGQRVELNAMTSDQLIVWLEQKLSEHGMGKVIPDKTILDKAYRRANFRLALQEEIEGIKEGLENDNIKIPKKLSEMVQKRVKNSQLSWDKAIWDIVSEETKKD